LGLEPIEGIWEKDETGVTRVIWAEEDAVVACVMDEGVEERGGVEFSE